MSATLVGAGLGAIAGVGALTAIRSAPPVRRIRLEDRVAPYLGRHPRRRNGAGPDGSTPILRALHHVAQRLAVRLDRMIGGTTSVRRRLEQSASACTVEEFRVEQVIWAAGGLAIGLLLALLAAIRGSTAAPVAFSILALVLAIAGALMRDRRLSVAVSRRAALIAAEFPTVAELLALAVAAGESPVGALRRVSGAARGALSAELGRALVEVDAGRSLVAALEDMAARSSVAPLARFVDGLAVAVERGTPLADVLRAQAADVREASRRDLLEASGRKEIAMLVPVVFFVLPVTVVFALFPGFATLHLSVP